MKKIYTVLALMAGSAYASDSLALEACAKSTENGGISTVTVTDPIDATSWGLPRDPADIRSDAAEAAQEQYGNNVAYDTTIGITFQFTVTGGGAGVIYNFPALNYSGEQSLEMFLLESIQDDDNQPTEDPSPCDKEKNEENGALSTAGGGGESTGGAGGGGGYLDLSGIPIYVNGTCVSSCPKPGRVTVIPL